MAVAERDQAHEAAVLEDWLRNAALLVMKHDSRASVMVRARAGIETAFQLGVILGMEYPSLIGPALISLDLGDPMPAVHELVERMMGNSR